MKLTAVLVFACCLGPALSLTKAKFNELRTFMAGTHWADAAHDRWLATTVRLAFHDCVGGCDGCINLAHPEDSNKSLEGAIQNLEAVWDGTTYGTPISEEYPGLTRGDFWQVAALGAIDNGITRANRRRFNRGVPALGITEDNFKIGRQNCASATATSSSTSEEHVFPNPTMSYQDMIDYFGDDDGFDFTSEEVAALMGAHTFGSMRRTGSGYAGVWIDGETHVFDSNFYKVMLEGQTFGGDTCTWKNKLAGGNRNPKWMHRCARADNTNAANMIHTDFEVFYDVTMDPTTHEATCDVNPDAAVGVKCLNSGTHTTAATFVDVTTWLPKFSEVYLKMTEHTSSTLVALED